MSVAEQINIRELLQETSPLSPQEVEAYEEIIMGPQLTDLRMEVQRLANSFGNPPSGPENQLVRVGVCFSLLGKHREAETFLAPHTDNGAAQYYLGLVYLAEDRAADAEQVFAKAAKLGYDRVECVLKQAGAVRRQGNVDRAEELVRSVSKEGAGRAEYSYQMGCIWADRGDTLGAVEYFERAVDMDPHHSQALFWLAGENFRLGNDAEAIRLYEQSLSKPPYHLGALMNLGVLYEDSENYGAARYCYTRVQDADPMNQRAAMFIKDVEATSNMYYDEDMARNEARMEQLLKRPITDFELSVRSRNCLQAMNIFTLGDLTETSESELLAGKNFGETSLHEIQELMTAHGLKIGQNLHQAKTHEAVMLQQNLSPQEQALLNKPVSDLNLSVRSRKCMVRLGITSIGELVQRTPDELLGSRNFGVTSLNEIRGKLGELNLKLRND